MNKTIKFPGIRAKKIIHPTISAQETNQSNTQTNRQNKLFTNFNRLI